MNYCRSRLLSYKVTMSVPTKQSVAYAESVDSLTAYRELGIDGCMQTYLSTASKLSKNL
jgi:hypothetical protein